MASSKSLEESGMNNNAKTEWRIQLQNCVGWSSISGWPQHPSIVSRWSINTVFPFTPPSDLTRHSHYSKSQINSSLSVAPTIPFHLLPNDINFQISPHKDWTQSICNTLLSLLFCPRLPCSFSGIIVPKIKNPGSISSCLQFWGICHNADITGWTYLDSCLLPW